MQSRTHTVENQAPPLHPFDPWAIDRPLQEAVVRERGEWGVERCRALAKVAGSEMALEHAERAERNQPRLLTHDRFGHRIDEVKVDPSWTWLLRKGVEHELHALPWRVARPGGHVVRAALAYLWCQVDMGVMTPLSTTLSAIPMIRSNTRLSERWESRLLSNCAEGGALAGITTTEKQGGADLRATLTEAAELGDGRYRLTGHKWFCSYPGCNIFITLARTDAGLGCFVFETADEGFQIQRLKDKLGTRSLASAEIELDGVQAHIVGEASRGLQAIMRMINLGRFECVMASSPLMRSALTHALHHTRHRQAFGSALAEQPLMQNVLADLALESEAATTTLLRIARAFDEADEPFARLATAVMKYWICKRASAHVNEALECLGGNGYVEESTLPRLYRDVPLNAIWEGPGNVAALDVLRCLRRDPAAYERVRLECERARGVDPRLDTHLVQLERMLDRPTPEQARALTEALAIVLQASLLTQHAPTFVAEAFCAARIAAPGALFGRLGRVSDLRRLIERAMPQ